MVESGEQQGAAQWWWVCRANTQKYSPILGVFLNEGQQGALWLLAGTLVYNKTLIHLVLLFEHSVSKGPAAEWLWFWYDRSLSGLVRQSASSSCSAQHTHTLLDVLFPTANWNRCVEVDIACLSKEGFIYYFLSLVEDPNIFFSTVSLQCFSTI